MRVHPGGSPGRAMEAIMIFDHTRNGTMTLAKRFATAGVAVALGLTQPALAADYVIRLSHGMPEALSSGQHAWELG
jgi:hypothetical protein